MFTWKVCKWCKKVLNKEWHNPTGKEIIYFWEHPKMIEWVECPECEVKDEKRVY